MSLYMKFGHISDVKWYKVRSRGSMGWGGRMGGADEGGEVMTVWGISTPGF